MGKGGKSKGGKGKRPPEPEGPPEAIEVVGEAMHECENEMICKCTNERIPHFNARIFLENKEEIGKVDEIFGPINSFFFSIKMHEGMKADSFKKGKQVYIDNMKLLPLQRFLPQPGGGKGKGKGKGKDKGKGKGKGKAKGKFGKDKGGGGGFAGRGGGGGAFAGRGGGDSGGGRGGGGGRGF